MSTAASVLCFPPHHTSCFLNGGFANRSHSVLGHAQPTACSASPPASPRHSNDHWWYRNLNLLSIAYCVRSRLRSRLTLSGRTFLRKPQIFGGQDSHLPLATHANILSRIQSTVPYGSASSRIRCSSTMYITSRASVPGLSPVYLRRRVTRLVSCYALFE